MHVSIDTKTGEYKVYSSTGEEVTFYVYDDLKQKKVYIEKSFDSLQEICDFFCYHTSHVASSQISRSHPLSPPYILPTEIGFPHGFSTFFEVQKYLREQVIISRRRAI